ncbi:MAG TPA: hypothetical protein DDX29_04685 [Clostridiales bacterium]|nr:hypothetical protein [Clostridiales bacterium]
MKKRLITIIIIIMLVSAGLIGCSGSSAPATTTQATTTTAPTESVGDSINSEYEFFGEFGKVLQSIPIDNSVYIVAEGYYGYHMEDDPSMTMGVTIGSDGVILDVVNVANKDQTEGFADMITEDYLTSTFVGLSASPVLEVDSVTGATVTSKAVIYAVQTASYYAENVYGYVADTISEDISELNEVFAANYKTISSDYKVDETMIGSVLYAAEGASSDGTKVLAVKVRSADRVNFEGTARTGWDSAMPNPFTMIIVIDKNNNSVIAWKILTDGSNEPDYFTVSDEAINSYMTVEIVSEDVFDDFTEGLVFNLDYEKDLDADGNSIIAGTSILYTGATESGTFSSQLIRQCFRTAAYFYMNY